MSNNLSKLLARAVKAATAMKAQTDHEWFQIAYITAELAGKARTNRAMVRLMKISRYAEIQAYIGTEYTQAQGDSLWAAYCRGNWN